MGDGDHMLLRVLQGGRDHGPVILRFRSGDPRSQGRCRDQRGSPDGAGVLEAVEDRSVWPGYGGVPRSYG